MAYVKNGELPIGATHPNLGTNESADGIISYGTLGESGISFGTLLYLNVDGRWYKALADSEETMPCRAMAVWTERINKVCPILKQGFIRNDSWSFPLSENKLYVSKVTSGLITLASPTDYRQVVGNVEKSNIVYFNPEHNVNYGSNNRITIKDLENDVNGLYKYHTETISYPIFSAGKYEMFKKHPRLKILEAWVETKNNTEEEQVIELPGITAPLYISDTYRSGVAIPLVVLRNVLSINEPVYINVSTNRYVTVNLLCESGEE